MMIISKDAIKNIRVFDLVIYKKNKQYSSEIFDSDTQKSYQIELDNTFSCEDFYLHNSITSIITKYLLSQTPIKFSSSKEDYADSKCKYIKTIFDSFNNLSYIHKPMRFSQIIDFKIQYYESIVWRIDAIPHYQLKSIKNIIESISKDIESDINYIQKLPKNDRDNYANKIKSLLKKANSITHNMEIQDNIDNTIKDLMSDDICMGHEIFTNEEDSIEDLSTNYVIMSCRHKNLRSLCGTLECQKSKSSSSPILNFIIRSDCRRYEFKIFQIILKK